MWVFTVPVCSQTSQGQQQLSWEHMLNIRAYWAVENPPRNALPGTPYSQHSIPRLPKLCTSWQEGWSSSRISCGSQNASSWNGPARVKSHSWLTSSGAAELSIPTCSTVRTANKRLKATQIQGTSLSSSLWPTASGLHSFSRPNTNEDPHTIPGSAADPLKSLAFLLHLLPCTFTGAITLTPHWVEQGLVSVCLHSAVNLQCSRYVNHYYHSLLLPGPTVTGWNSKFFSSFSCFTVSEINSAEVSPEITPPSIYHTLFKCQDSNKPKNLKTLLIRLSTDAHPKETAHGHQHWLRPICLLSQLLLRYSSLQFISLPWLSLCHLNQDLLILSFFLLRGILMKLHQRSINTSNISSLLASLHRAHWNTFFPILPK